MKSCIYEGHVRHSRYKPFEHKFHYSVFFLYLDLAELDTVFTGHPLWSTTKVNLAYLRREDHFGDPSVTIEQSVRDLVQDRTGKRPSGPVRMLTHLRYFGHNFNPMTFFYCYDSTDSRVETIVVEVHNTPWREAFCYVLDASRNEGTQDQKRFRFPKVFHVSPFIDMDIDYDWTFNEPGDSVTARMIASKNEQIVFKGELEVQQRQLDGSALSMMLFKYPLITLKVKGGYYWHAFLLYMKGAPFYPHPSKRPK
jgi:DUF1365 family protein